MSCDCDRFTEVDFIINNGLLGIFGTVSVPVLHLVETELIVKANYRSLVSVRRPSCSQTLSTVR